MFASTILLLFLFNSGIDCEPEIQTIHSTVTVRPGNLTLECTPPSEVANNKFMFIWYNITGNDVCYLL